MRGFAAVPVKRRISSKPSSAQRYFNASARAGGFAADPFRNGDFLILKMRLLDDPLTEITCDIGNALDWVAVKGMPQHDFGSGHFAEQIAKWRGLDSDKHRVLVEEADVRS